MLVKSVAKSPRIRAGIAGLLLVAGIALAVAGARRATDDHWTREDRKADARAASRRETAKLRQEVLNGRH